jgi:hypothetical protein
MDHRHRVAPTIVFRQQEVQSRCTRCRLAERWRADDVRHGPSRAHYFGECLGVQRAWRLARADGFDTAMIGDSGRLDRRQTITDLRHEHVRGLGKW